jgi:hypothetical protein
LELLKRNVEINADLSCFLRLQLTVTRIKALNPKIVEIKEHYALGLKIQTFHHSTTGVLDELSSRPRALILRFQLLVITKNQISKTRLKVLESAKHFHLFLAFSSLFISFGMKGCSLDMTLH